MRGVPEVLGHRHAARRRRRGVAKSGSCGLPSTSSRLQRWAISTVLASALGRSAKSASICACDLEVLLAAEALDAPRVGQHLALGDADARLVRLVVVGPRNCTPCVATTGSAQLRGERHRGAHVRLVARQAGALHLDVEAVAEDRSAAAPPAPAPAPSSPAAAPGRAAPLSAPESTIRPALRSASHSHLIQAWPRCALSQPAARQQLAAGSGSPRGSAPAATQPARLLVRCLRARARPRRRRSA